MNSFQDQSSSQRQQTVYQRSYIRNMPSQTLQPYLDSRPVQTKYSVMPVVDPTRPNSTPLTQHATYSPNKVFYPGNDFGPWSGYASNVNDESDLRNQIYARQCSSKAVYVPSSKSSLYQVGLQNSEKPVQPYPNLFKTEQFNPVNPNPSPNTIGFSLFNNATRQQVKDLTNTTTCK